MRAGRRGAGDAVTSARLRAQHRDERGLALAFVALSMTALLTFAALAIDVGYWYTVANKVQKAADAAALAAAPDMPDLTAATTTATDIARRNGFVADAITSVTVAAVANQPGSVRVTISRTVTNFFAGVAGYRTQLIRRTAVAAFQGEIPMGSPVNSLGNQPSLAASYSGTGSNSWSSAEPGTQGNYAPFIKGYNDAKGGGDRYAAHAAPPTCNYKCVGGVNQDYVQNGYVYKIRIDPSAAGQDVAVEVFDPAVVVVGERCESASLDTATGGLYERGLTTANGKALCTGDNVYNAAFQTSFVMRNADTTAGDLYDNSIIDTATCRPQRFGSFSTAINMANAASTGVATVDPQRPTGTEQYVALPLRTERDLFRKWVRVCTFTVPASFGSAPYLDYELQVTTGYQWNQGTRVLDPSVNSSGENEFYLRAATVAGSGAFSSSAPVAVFAAGRLPVHVNDDTSNVNFYLAQITPGANGRRLTVDFWDISDAGGSGNFSVKVLPPPGATSTASPAGITSFPGCTGVENDITPLGARLDSATCVLTDPVNFDNGDLISVSIPIPDGYACGTGTHTTAGITYPNDCWIRVQFAFPSGLQPIDHMTWTAELAGDPLRLAE